MTPERRAELRALREAGTPGEWESLSASYPYPIAMDPNHRLIVAAVNALVPLLDALDAAETKADQYAADWYAAKSEFGSAQAKTAQRLREVTAERDALAKRVAKLEGELVAAVALNEDMSEARVAELEHALRYHMGPDHLEHCRCVGCKALKGGK